jgi:hypothetical protein
MTKTCIKCERDHPIDYFQSGLARDNPETLRLLADYVEGFRG